MNDTTKLREVLRCIDRALGFCEGPAEDRSAPGSLFAVRSDIARARRILGDLNAEAAAHLATAAEALDQRPPDFRQAHDSLERVKKALTASEAQGAAA